MTTERLYELMQAADDEYLSYGEIAEIDAEATLQGIDVTDMSVIDTLIELESRL